MYKELVRLVAYTGRVWRIVRVWVCHSTEEWHCLVHKELRPAAYARRVWRIAWVVRVSVCVSSQRWHVQLRYRNATKASWMQSLSTSWRSVCLSDIIACKCFKCFWSYYVDAPFILCQCGCSYVQISQGSVATDLRWGGWLYSSLPRSSYLNAEMKELWKSLF